MNNAVSTGHTKPKEKLASQRQRWSLLVLSLSLFAAAAAILTNPTVSFTAEQWGLVTQLSPFYWIGLLLIGLLAYLGRESKFYLSCVFVLVVLYLFIIPTLIAGHNLDFAPQSLYDYREGVLIAQNGHLVPNSSDPLIRYQYWPGFLYFSAFFNLVTRLNSMAVIDFLSMLTITVDGILAFAILRTRLKALPSLMGAILVIAGFWTTQQQFHAQGLAYIQYLTFILILFKLTYDGMKNTLVLTILMLVTFMATVITHPLTPLLILSSIIGMYLINRLTRKVREFPGGLVLPISLVVIFVGYWIYMAVPAFSSGVLKVQGMLEGQQTTSILFTLSRLTLTTKYSLLTILASYLALIPLGAIALIALLKYCIKKETRAEFLWWGAWLVFLFLPGTIIYAHEGLIRAYIFGLVPLAFLAIKLVGNKPRILITIFVVILLLHIPAHYGFAGYMRTVTPAEDAGTAFYVQNTPADSTRFYGASWLPALWYQDPLSVRSKWFTLTIPPFEKEVLVVGSSALPPLSKARMVFYGEVPYFGLPDLKFLYGDVQYVGYSTLLKDYFIYYLGFDPLAQLHIQDWSNTIYDNGDFQLYHNIECNQVNAWKRLVLR